MKTKDWSRFIFDSSISFVERCRIIYRFQRERNQFYEVFSTALGFSEYSDIEPDQIPLLPIRAFKQDIISVSPVSHQTVFKSSGSTGLEQSSHYVHDTEIYKLAISQGFYSHFPKEKFALLCFLPGYSDNPNSSLIWMMRYLISKDKTGLSAFLDENVITIDQWNNRVLKSGKIPLLFGAAFGLLDLVNEEKILISGPIEIIETGGMKTYRREIPKEQLRKELSEYFQIPESSIHSEYGMCELMSQMYAIGNEWFTTPNWVRVTIRDPENPARICNPGEEGKIGIIDLANVYSCPFILTDDRGVADESGKFKVLGRWHPDNPRGCNFLIDRDS